MVRSLLIFFENGCSLPPLAYVEPLARNRDPLFHKVPGPQKQELQRSRLQCSKEKKTNPGTGVGPHFAASYSHVARLRMSPRPKCQVAAGKALPRLSGAVLAAMKKNAPVI
jgi:hypothetical protein